MRFKNAMDRLPDAHVPGTYVYCCTSVCRMGCTVFRKRSQNALQTLLAALLEAVSLANMSEAGRASLRVRREFHERLYAS